MSRSSRLPKSVRRHALTLATASAALAVAPPAALADTTLQAETFGLAPVTAGKVVSDTAASGGKALKIWANGAASKSVVTTERSAKIVARARGQQCAGAPKVDVYVNGSLRGSLSVSNTSYANLTSDVTLPAGTHTVKAAFSNDYKSKSCDRNVILDSFTLKAPVLSAPTGGSAVVAGDVVTLDWADSSGNVAYYAVRRGTQPDPNTGTWTRLASNFTSSSATDQPGAGTYYYYVTAVDANGVVSPRSAVFGPAVVSTAPAPTPTPTPTPTATPVPEPTVTGTGIPTGIEADIFSSDFTDGSFSEFTEQIHPERVSIVDDPALGSARKVLKFHVYNSDTGPTENPRAQLETPYDFKEGEERYAGFSYRFPSNFPTLLPSQGWITLGSIAYGPPFNGAGPMTLRVQNRVGGGGAEIRWQRNGTYNYDIPWAGPKIADLNGGWVDFVMRAKLHRDPSIGFVELWMNTGSGWVQQKLMGQDRLYMSTYDASNGGGTNNSRLGLYYRKDIPGPLTMYHGGLKVASAGPDAFASVAPNSFR